ncbi:hypothetical protein [Massilia sp. DWR3-1-1]|uniref:hypothetical protein n=1 Tax=Massilia sp. DWR3-1-1 TaxID=2804559 RepID=UPI003CF2E19E
MKKFLCAVALVLGSIGAAQAQVYFDSGSARPNNPPAVRHDGERQHRAHPPVRARQKLVRCRDGARRVARMCRGHGGVARR